MCFFFFQAEDGIRDLVRSRGLEMCIRDRYKIIDELWIAYPQIENIELEINKLNPPIKADIESAAFYISINKHEWTSMQSENK